MCCCGLLPACSIPVPNVENSGISHAWSSSSIPLLVRFLCGEQRYFLLPPSASAVCRMATPSPTRARGGGSCRKCLSGLAVLHLTNTTWATPYLFVTWALTLLTHPLIHLSVYLSFCLYSKACVILPGWLFHAQKGLLDIVLSHLSWKGLEFGSLSV